MFLFSCYTGLAYIDLAELTPDNIITGIDGDLWIYTSRAKTDTSVRIPLLPKARELMEKYQDDPRAISNGTVFPVISNQRTNGYLKEIAEICEINTDLTFHIARHTFATTVTLSNGVPIESVSKMLGHTSIRTTQIYAKVVEHKLSEDMQNLRERLSEAL
ncbi:Tyrosine recombinase XerD [compost metagenome]